MSADGVLQKDTKNWDSIIRSGLAGGIAGCVAKTTVAPLDRVKILFQASSPEFQKYAGSWTGAFTAGTAIFKDAGVRGLFQGNSVTLLRIFPYAAVKFVTYDQAHAFLMPTPESETNLRRFTAGAMSGTTSVLLTYPLELIRVRLAFQTRAVSGTPTLSDTISLIYHEGASPSSSPQSSSMLPNPQTIQTRALHVFPILKFYRGFTVTMIGMIPYAGTSFLVWGYLRSRHPDSKEGSRASSTYSTMRSLGHGALAGAIAQTVSYPFEVIRRRMQVGGLTSPHAALSFMSTVRSVIKARGWQGLYVGLSIGYLKVIPMTAVSYTVWEALKRQLGI